MKLKRGKLYISERGSLVTVVKSHHFYSIVAISELSRAYETGLGLFFKLNWRALQNYNEVLHKPNLELQKGELYENNRLFLNNDNDVCVIVEHNNVFSPIPIKQFKYHGFRTAIKIAPKYSNAQSLVNRIHNHESV